MLRKFLFLNSDTVVEYLSALEGFIIDGEIDRKEFGKSDKGGKAGYKVFEAHLASESSTEDQQKLVITPQAMFERLYKILKGQDDIQTLDAFDEGIWNQLSRGEMLEIQAKIVFPELFTQLLAIPEVGDALASLKPVIDTVEALSGILGDDFSLDSEQRTQFEAIEMMGNAVKGISQQAVQQIPIVFEAISTPKYRFFARLPNQYLNTELHDLEGEAVVFGKVFRIVPEDQEVEVFSFTPGLTSSLDSLANLNRKQRRALESKGKGKNTTESLAQKIKGPAIVLDPVAIYR